MNAEEKVSAAGRKEAREAIRAIVPDLRVETVEAALEEDPGFAGEILLGLPGLASAQLKLLERLAAFVSGLPPEEREKLLKETAAGFDGKAVADAANRLTPLVMTVHRENPELASELFPAMETAFREIDFGKVREAAAAMLDYWATATEKMVELATENPVVIANLMGIVPVLLNALIRVLAHALEKLDLPSEILASAAFNMLEALDAEEIGRVLTFLAGQVNMLHAGNLILGRDEPRSHAVFTEFSKRVLDTTDVEEVAGAVVAVGEELEVIADSLVETVSRDPELVIVLSRTAVSLMNIATRVVSSTLDELNKLPGDVLASIGDKVGENFDPVEMGRALDSFVSLALRFRRANPDLHREMLAKTLKAVNIEQLDMLMRGISRDVIEAMGKDPGVRRALEPEEVGRRINEMVIAFNRSTAAGPSAVRDYVSRMLSAVDTRDLEIAARKVSDGLTDAFLESSDRGLALVRVVASGARRFMRFLFTLAKEKLSAILSG